MTVHAFEEEYFTNYYYQNVGNFDRVSLNKSKNWFHGWLKYLNQFVDLESGRGRKTLEIGCSIGGASHLLAERGFDVYASDISKYSLQRARRLAKKEKKNISFHRINVEKEIPLNIKFDIIIAFEVIEHLKNPYRAVIRMRQKLKKNGILICSTPNKKYDASSDPTHINVKNEIEWKKLFKKAAFKKIKSTQISFIPYLYNLNKYFQYAFPFRIKSKFINSPLFIIAWK